MNQILNLENKENQNNSNNVNKQNCNVIKLKNKLNNFLKIQFVFSNIITIFFIYYFISYRANINKQEQLSKELLNDFNISSLYNSNNTYETQKVYYNYDDNFSFYVIGIIEIPKIKITYPIISEVSDEFLKIAPCKFYGPELNSIRQCVYSSS